MKFVHIYYLSYRMKKLFLISILWLSHQAIAQVYPQIGARSNGLANSSLCLTDVWSIYNNPGAFGSLQKTELGKEVEYLKNYGDAELKPVI